MPSDAKASRARFGTLDCAQRVFSENASTDEQGLPLDGQYSPRETGKVLKRFSSPKGLEARSPKGLEATSPRSHAQASSKGTKRGNSESAERASSKRVDRDSPQVGDRASRKDVERREREENRQQKQGEQEEQCETENEDTRSCEEFVLEAGEADPLLMAERTIAVPRNVDASEITLAFGGQPVQTTPVQHQHVRGGDMSPGRMMRNATAPCSAAPTPLPVIGVNLSTSQNSALEVFAQMGLSPEDLINPSKAVLDHVTRNAVLLRKEQERRERGEREEREQPHTLPPSSTSTTLCDEGTRCNFSSKSLSPRGTGAAFASAPRFRRVLIPSKALATDVAMLNRQTASAVLAPAGREGGHGEGEREREERRRKSGPMGMSGGGLSNKNNGQPSLLWPAPARSAFSQQTHLSAFETSSHPHQTSPQCEEPSPPSQISQLSQVLSQSPQSSQTCGDVRRARSLPIGLCGTFEMESVVANVEAMPGKIPTTLVPAQSLHSQIAGFDAAGRALFKPDAFNAFFPPSAGSPRDVHAASGERGPGEPGSELGQLRLKARKDGRGRSYKGDNRDTEKEKAKEKASPKLQSAEMSETTEPLSSNQPSAASTPPSSRASTASSAPVKSDASAVRKAKVFDVMNQQTGQKRSIECVPVLHRPRIDLVRNFASESEIETLLDVLIPLTASPEQPRDLLQWCLESCESIVPETVLRRIAAILEIELSAIKAVCFTCIDSTSSDTGSDLSRVFRIYFDTQTAANSCSDFPELGVSLKPRRGHAIHYQTSVVTHVPTNGDVGSGISDETLAAQVVETLHREVLDEQEAARYLLTAYIVDDDELLAT